MVRLQFQAMEAMEKKADKNHISKQIFNESIIKPNKNWSWKKNCINSFKCRR